ncbi:hypothetical protein [Thermodesulforhabdus norvegica]|uniref:Phosphohydrolase n=1 Tax=Thermodesulforhabdus norvegica TaxID=39841 RepID=A0A1I4W379_9BACT|nr:hypothetical protein [Thermodesulforhabdus norvegica]SFN07790.1 hypothetical protein SAMN05660836_02580 [Thermodesulforhabdus norvegica]
MKCPGQDSRFWGKEAIFEARCPQCGSSVEFFKDEPSRRCRNCGHKFVNPRMDFGCAAYCKYADQCLGELPPELIAQREHLLKDRVAIEAKKRYGRDFAAISKAVRTARYAEELLRTEQGELPVVIIASHLHLLPYGAEKRPPAPEESARAAEEVLKSLSSKEELNRKVLKLIEKRDEKPDLSDSNHVVFHDAMSLALFEEELKRDPEAASTPPEVITPTARKILKSIMSKYGGNS